MNTPANPRPLVHALSAPAGLAPVHPELRRLWKKLPGKYEQSDGDSHFSLALKAITPYLLSVQTLTSAGELEKGWIVLADVSSSYRSPKLRFALEYRPDLFRREFTCILYGTPTAAGITFESEGTDCSFALGRRVSKVKIDLSSSGIALSGGDGGDPLILRRIGKS